MSVDSSRFLTAAKAAIREQASDVFRGTRAERDEWLDDEARDLAHSLADLAETRAREIRADLLLEWTEDAA